MIDTWERIINPNFLNAELIGDVGAEETVTIEDIESTMAFNPSARKEEPVICLYTKEHKPMILNKTNRKTLKRLFGSADPAACKGKKITLYVVSLNVGGNQTIGIRIKEYSEILCEECGKPLTATRSMSVAKLAEYSKTNTGRTLCLNCMKKLKEEQTNE